MWCAILLFLFIVGLLIYLDTKKPKNYPPGPAWLPVLGSAWQVHKDRNRTGNLFKAMAEWATKVGPIIGLKVGQDLIVVVHGVQEIRDFLLNEDLAGRPVGQFFNMRTWGQRWGVMLTDSEYWQEQRRFVLRQLREFGFGRRNMSYMIEDEAALMVAHLRDLIPSVKGVVDMESIFNVHILNTLWMMLAGVRYSPEDKNLKHLQHILSQLFNAIDMVGAPFSQFPILKVLAPQISGYKLYMDTHKQIWKFLDEEIQRHKQTFDDNNLRDFMDVYIKMLHSRDIKQSFCEKQLMAICMDMFMAGSETTSKTLGFCFLYLMLYPNVQRKAQEEIDRVVGPNRTPSLEDRPNMPYMECVVLEALRMFSGRAFTVPHRALRDTQFHGYFIPKDAIVVANMYGTLMSPEGGFEQPLEFLPERYLGPDGKITLTETYLPFGFGKHRCLGETLARANVFLFTATLLQNFSFLVVPGTAPSLESVDGVTPGPVPYKALVVPR